LIGSAVGPYQILEKLGAGGMGEVFLGHDPRLERRVALKCLIAAETQSGEERARVLREARTAARLTHPNIAAVYDVLEQNNRTFIVMEYVEGISLAAHLAAGPLPTSAVRDIGRQIASALTAAHAQGVIHRDLKPANVQVMRDGTIKVLDFGVAKLTGATSTATEATTLNTLAEQTLWGSAGTPAYMSPEQLSHRPLDARTDIYSAGVMLFLMATGRRPFLETNAVSLGMAIASAPAPAASDVNPSVPADLSTVIAKSLERQPERRFQSAHELERALTATGDSAPTGAETMASLPAGGSPASRWRRLGIPAMAIGALLVIGIVARNSFETRVVRGGSAPAAIPLAKGSIAVLPLENLSGDSSQDYVADGMTDAIIAELGRIRSLRVISRQSVMRYRHTTATLPQIARELGVGAVITGSVMRAGEELRVTLALVEPSPERQLWSATYNRGVGDMLTLSGEVAQAAAAHVQATVTPEERAELARARPVNAEAQQAYLLGRFFWNKRTKADNERAIREFTRVIELDPKAALAFAGLADCFIVAWDNAYMAPEEAYRQAKANATRALQLDDTIAEAHASLGSVYSFGLLWSAAEQEYRRAIELNPGYATAYQWRALNLSRLGRHAEAIAEARHALDLDPLSRVQNASLGKRLYVAGDYAAAAAQLRKTVDLDPNFSTAHNLLGLVLIEQGEPAAAVKELERGSQLDGSVSGDMGYVYGRAGDTAAATRVLNQLLRQRDADPYQIAFVHLGLGHRDLALDWFTKAYRGAEVFVADLAVDPRLAPVSTDPRFLALLQKSGLKFSPGRPHS
jgi:TolB-like protein/Tfp pilus assembly protein PilF